MLSEGREFAQADCSHTTVTFVSRAFWRFMSTAFVLRLVNRESGR